jgi:hypothetical protein
MPNDEVFWRDMEQRFRVIRDDDLQADYTYYKSLGEHWGLRGGLDKLVQERFAIEARHAGAAIGDDDTHRDALFRWLDFLVARRRSWLKVEPFTGYAEQADGSKEPIVVGTIARVVEKSALICRLLQAEAKSGIPVSASPPASAANDGTNSQTASKFAAETDINAAPKEGRPPPNAGTHFKHLSRKPLRRSPQYEKIDTVLKALSEARPEGHREVFQQLDSRKVPIPNRKPFKFAGGWVKGFTQDRHSASTWLSQRWGKLGLRPFARGPKE